MGRTILAASLAAVVFTSLVFAEQPGRVQRGGIHDRPARQDPHANRRIKRGDLLRLVLYDVDGPDTETAKEFRVSGDGDIQLPLIEKPLRAAGRTIHELEEAIQNAYRDFGAINIDLRVELLDEKPPSGPSK